MTFTVYPVGADTGFTEESALSSGRETDRQAFAGRMRDFVVDPFTGGDFGLTTSASSFDVDVAAGEAFAAGHYVESTQTETRTVTDNATVELYLVVADIKSDNADIVTSTSGTPSGQATIKLWEVTTDGSGVTGSTDFRPFVPFRGDVVEASLTGVQTKTVTGQAVDSTGNFSVSVSFPQAYQSGADDVAVTLSDLSDQSARVVNIFPSSITQSGCTVNYTVDVAGGSGATADFTVTARGA